MDHSTRIFVSALIRHGKGVLSAAQAWLDASDAAERIGYAVRSGHASDAAGIPAMSSQASPRVDDTTGG